MPRRADHVPYGAWPEMLTQGQAASYCGVAVSEFVNRCPIPPTEIPGRNRKPIRRYRRNRLDEWLNSLDGPRPPRSGLRAFVDATRKSQET